MAIRHAKVWRVEARTLLALPAFAGLSSAARQDAAAEFHGLRYGIGETVISQSRRDQFVCFVVSGSVRVTFYSEDGQEVGFRDLGPGEMFGEIAAIDGEPRSAQVLTLEETFIAQIAADRFKALLHRYREVGDYVLKHLTRLVRLLSERVVEFGTLGVSNRIHAELLRLVRSQDPLASRLELRPSPTHAEIAARICSHREAVTREINRLVREGVVEKHGRSLVVTDVPRLQRLVLHVADVVPNR